MQASKHSPQSKKSPHPIAANGSNLAALQKASIVESKSVAQRVMDVGLIGGLNNQQNNSETSPVGTMENNLVSVSSGYDNAPNGDIRSTIKSASSYDSIESDQSRRNGSAANSKEINNNNTGSIASSANTNEQTLFADMVVPEVPEAESDKQQVATASSTLIGAESASSITNSNINNNIKQSDGHNSPASLLLESLEPSTSPTQTLVSLSPVNTAERTTTNQIIANKMRDSASEAASSERAQNNSINNKSAESQARNVPIVQSGRLVNCITRIEQLGSGQSILKQVVSKSIKETNSDGDDLASAQSKQPVQKANPYSRDMSTISLNTRVPHPSQSYRHNGFHSEEEEVSYLNLGGHNNRAACSSLDNATKPILLAAAREQRFGLQPKTAASFQHLQQNLIRHQQPHQPQPQQQQQQQQQLHQQHQLNIRRQSTTSAHEYEGMYSDYDEYDMHYGNALVEKRIRLKELEDQRQATLTMTNSSRNNIIESLYDCSNACSSTSNHQQPPHEGCTSVPASPKAKSAPATPCNITPTAFHQHNPNDVTTTRGATIGGQVHLMNNRNTKDARRALMNRTGEMNQKLAIELQDLIKRGELALKNEEYEAAIAAFSQCIDRADYQFLKKNFKILGQRAEAHLKIRKYKNAIDDSMAARELNPKWTQAYYLQGLAQMHNGDYPESLAALSCGLAQDPSSTALFSALIDSALQSIFKQEFEPKFEKLCSLRLDKQPFIVVSILGQELLAKNFNEHAAFILESALKLGSLSSSEDRKFKSSVLSSIAYAYCMLKDYERAIVYMQRELDIECDLEDVAAQCRVLSNLGFTYYRMRKFDKSLEAHRRQLSLALKSDLYQQASFALNAIGHVHVARNDFQDALTSHTRCLDIMRQLGDNDMAQFKEILSIGHVCCMMNDFKLADERYREAEQFLNNKQCKLNHTDFIIGSIMHRFNTAYLALKRQNFFEATKHYNDVIHYSRELSKSNMKLGTLYEMRASNGMGHTFRLSKRFEEARTFFEQQLHLAKSLGDLNGQSQALCNLGMTCQHFKEYAQAMHYFERNRKLVKGDQILSAYASSYIGSMHFVLGHYGEAQSHYETSLRIFKELEYCAAEKKTVELNLAFVHERLGHQDLSYINSLGEQPATTSTTTATTIATAATTTSTTHQKRVMMAS